MIEFSTDDVIVLLKQKVADLTLEVEMYRQYVRQLEQRLGDTAVTMGDDTAEADVNAGTETPLSG